jgi:hypothetical protein
LQKIEPCIVNSVADPGCFSRIPDPDPTATTKIGLLLSQVTANYSTFYLKNFHEAFRNMGWGSGIRENPVSDPNVKEAPDPEAATLIVNYHGSALQG